MVEERIVIKWFLLRFSFLSENSPYPRLRPLLLNIIQLLEESLLKRFPLKFSRFFNKPAGFRILILNIVPENMKDRNL